MNRMIVFLFVFVFALTERSTASGLSTDTLTLTQEDWIRAYSDGAEEPGKDKMGSEVDPEVVDEWSVTLASRVWSKYLGSNGGIFHDKPVIQTDLTVAHKNGVYFNLWSSFGLESIEVNDDFGDEVDFTVAWAGEGPGISWDIGLAYLASFDLRLIEDDFLQLYIEGKKDFAVSESQKISPFVHLDYYTDTRFSFFKPYIEGGLYHAWQMTETISVESRLSILYDTGAFGFDSGFIAKYKGGLNWKIDGNITLEFPYIKASTPLSTDNRESELIFGCGIRITF